MGRMPVFCGWQKEGAGMGLLFKEENEPVVDLYKDSYKDLAIEELVCAVTPEEEERQFFRQVFHKMPVRFETVRYRQEILRDFLLQEEFCTKIEEAVKKLKILYDFKSHARSELKKAVIWELIEQLNELEIYVDVIGQLEQIFTTHPPVSEGLCAFASRIHALVADGSMELLKQDLDRIRVDMSRTKSLKLGVNLDLNLLPEEVMLLEMGPEPCVQKDSLFSKLMRYANAKSQQGGLVYRMAEDSMMNPKANPRYQGADPMMQTLTREVEKMLSKLVKNIRATLRKYIDMDGYFVVGLLDELKYYVHMAKFGRKLQKEGYTICMPEISGDVDELKISRLYNLRLAIKGEKEIVPNDFCFSKKEKIYILTGPNRGGKTVLTQGIGLAAFMAGMGLFVTAGAYTGYLIRQIYTQFPADENETISYGRLGEEAMRLQEMVKEMEDRSLVLLNETYSTTCASDGLYLAKDLLRILKLLSPAVVYNTHIHELAMQTEQMNAWEGESDIVSIIMEIVDGKNTFRVLKSQPDGSSYARNIALKFGVTYEQMLEQIKDREKKA